MPKGYPLSRRSALNSAPSLARGFSASLSLLPWQIARCRNSWDLPVMIGENPWLNDVSFGPGANPRVRKSIKGTHRNVLESHSKRFCLLFNEINALNALLAAGEFYSWKVFPRFQVRVPQAHRFRSHSSCLECLFHPCHHARFHQWKRTRRAFAATVDGQMGNCALTGGTRFRSLELFNIHN